MTISLPRQLRLFAALTGAADMWTRLAEVEAYTTTAAQMTVEAVRSQQ